MNFLNKGGGLNRFLMVAAIAANLGSLVARADVVYAVDNTITSSDPTGDRSQTDTVDGTITTNGTMGVLAPADILSWNLDLIDGLNSANDVDLENANSSIAAFSGNALKASASALWFNYSGNGEFGIQENGFAFNSAHFFCLSTGVFACFAGETISPNNVFLDGVVTDGTGSASGIDLPEPSPVILLMTMLLGVAFAARKRIGRDIRAKGWVPRPSLIAAGAVLRCFHGNSRID